MAKLKDVPLSPNQFTGPDGGVTTIVYVGGRMTPYELASLRMHALQIAMRDTRPEYALALPGSPNRKEWERAKDIADKFVEYVEGRDNG